MEVTGLGGRIIKMRLNIQVVNFKSAQALKERTWTTEMNDSLYSYLIRSDNLTPKLYYSGAFYILIV